MEGKFANKGPRNTEGMESLIQFASPQAIPAAPPEGPKETAIQVRVLPSKGPINQAPGKKFAGFYLPPKQIRWIKKRAYDLDSKQSHVVEAAIDAAMAKEKAK